MATLDEEDFSSDTSDEDYVPQEEAGSEEEESGEEEPALEADGNHPKKEKKKGTKKVNKRQIESLLPRKRQGGIKLDDENFESGEVEEKDTYNVELAKKIDEETEKAKEQNEKKKVDDLWAAFKADVGAPKQKQKPVTKSGGFGSFTSAVKTTTTPTSSLKAVSTSSKPSETKSDKLTIMKEFDFAGETVKITKEVDIDSREAKKELKKQEEQKNAGALPGPSFPGLKRPGGGLGNVLGLIGKKPKMGTLDKSKLDWEKFKAKEGIQEELQSHNRGKEGYIERQAFLNRTDLRQFEIERDIRLGMSGKR